MKKKKLFIEDLEKRRSTSPLFVSTQAIGENGTVSKDKMPEYGGDRGFKKPNDEACITYEEYLKNNPKPKPMYAPPDPRPKPMYAPPDPRPIYTTTAMGEEGNLGKPWFGFIRKFFHEFKKPIHEKIVTTRAIGEEGNLAK